MRTHLLEDSLVGVTVEVGLGKWVSVAILEPRVYG